MDGGPQQALQALHHCGKEQFQGEEIFGAADRRKLGGFHQVPFSALFLSSPHTCSDRIQTHEHARRELLGMYAAT